MADKRKHDDKPEDPKSKKKDPIHSLGDLELPEDSGPHSDIEPIEVVEVVEDDEILEVAESASESGIIEVEEAASESGIIEVEEAAAESGIIEVEEAASESGIMDVVDVVEEAEGPDHGPKSAKPVSHADEEIEIDDSDSVEVLPSSRNVIDAPLVEEAEAEVIEAAEAVSDISKLTVQPQETRAEDVAVDADDLIVEGEGEGEGEGESASAIDLDKKAASTSDRPSGVDIIAEAVESGVDIAHSKTPTPTQPKAKTGSDSDIDLESILDDSAESSAVDLGAPAKRSLPESGTPISGEAVDKLVGVEDTEDAEVIDESLLIDSAEGEGAGAVEAVEEDDDAELVTPKKKHAAAAEAEEHSNAEAFEHIEDAEGVEAVAEAAAEEKPVPAKKGREKEKVLVGAGAGGGRRGGFMPFMFGGLLAVLLVGGGGAAAWYLGMLPQSPSAPSSRPKANATVAAAGTHSKTDQALDLIIDGKSQDALKQLENAPAKSPEAALKDLLELKNKAGKNGGDAQELEAAKEAAKDAEAKYASVLAKQKDLEAAKAKSEAALQEFNDALTKAGLKDVKDVANLAAGAKGGDALKKELDDVSKELAQTVKERDVTAKRMAELGKAVDAALMELKEGNFLGNDPDALKLLVDGTKKARLSGQSPLGSSLGGVLGAFGGVATAPSDLFKKALENGKLSAALAAAKTKNAFPESPEHRLSTIVALLNDRSFADPKELESFKRFIDWVRSKDAKTSGELRAKALYATALLERNQKNVAAARQTLELAIKEAQAAKGGAALESAANKTLADLNNPAVTVGPGLEQRIAAGQFKEAVEEITAALTAAPDQPQLSLKRAQILLEAAQAGKADPAMQKLARDDAEAARKDPTLAAESFYLVGRLDEINGELAKAEEYYRAAFKLAGTGTQADRYRAALARVLLRAGFSDLEENDEEECAMLDDDDAPAAAQIGGEGPVAVDPEARKRLEESIKIAEELIQKDNPKTQGEGYMLLGVAQAKLGRTNDGLKNLVKGLRLTNPTWSTKELEQIINNHPAFRQPDDAAQPNPLMADKHFSNGLDQFWARNYSGAEIEFAKAISFYDEDARYRYFLGMSRYLQGTQEKMKLAEFDFNKGVMLEVARHPGSREVNASLERVQGDLRRVLNAYRERPR